MNSTDIAAIFGRDESGSFNSFVVWLFDTITAPRHEPCMTSFLEAWKEKQEKY